MNSLILHINLMKKNFVFPLLVCLMLVGIMPFNVKAAFPFRPQQTVIVENFDPQNNIAATDLKQAQVRFRTTDKIPSKQTPTDNGATGIISFIMSALGMLMPVELAILAFPLFLVGAILGIIGSQNHRKMKGFAIAGLILSFIGMVFVLLLLTAL